MKKWIFGSGAVCAALMITGCATTFVGEPKKPENKSLTVNNYYFIMVADKGEEFGRHKTPGDPGARRMEYNHKKRKGDMPQTGADHRKQRGRSDF